jgi:hypothetical protein
MKPAEQYHRPLLEQLAELEADGFGEVEVHLHHGVEKPDKAENLRRALAEFRDLLSEEHRCLSRFDGVGQPRYAFVHGNLALTPEGALADLLQRTGGGWVVNQNDDAGILAAVREIFHQWKEGRIIRVADPAVVRAFDRRALAGRLGDLFDRLS